MTSIKSGITNILQLTLGRDIVLIEPELAHGGEGKIHRIQGDPNSVAKIFHKPSAEKTAKIRAMLANPPYDRAFAELGHISIAWPAACIVNIRGECIGFTMPSIDLKTYFPLFIAYNPQNRLKTIAELTWEDLLQIAYNVSYIVMELHNAGYVIGDINESNFLFNTQGYVTLVDCDSVQVPRTGGGFFRCTVGKPEFTPPELQGKDLSTVDRKPYSDDFSLAILIFLLLMEGRHPFSGVWRGPGNPPTIPQHIKEGNFPYINPVYLFLPKHALPFDVLPPDVRRKPGVRTKMKSCFVTNHHVSTFLGRQRGRLDRRPTAEEWCEALQQAQNHLHQCNINSSHFYGSHLKDCPWCKRAELGTDPFPEIPTDDEASTGTGIGLRSFVWWTATILLLLAMLALYIVEYRNWPVYGHILGPIVLVILLAGVPAALVGVLSLLLRRALGIAQAEEPEDEE